MNRRHPSRIVFSITSIFAAFFVLIVAFIVSSFFVLNVASSSADQLKLEVDREAVSNFIKRETADLAQRQSQVSWWDTSVEAITDSIDQAYFADAMLDWFPNEYDIERSALISPTGAVLLHSEGEQFVDGERSLSFAAQTEDLVRRAQEKYMALRVKEDDGFWVEEDPILEKTRLFAHDIRQIDGLIGFVIAQAIIPDGDYLLPDGPAHILVVYRPFTEYRISQYAAEIELDDFFVSSAAPKDSSNVVVVKSELTDAKIYFSWESTLPSRDIWSDSMPTLIGMLALVTLVMFGVTVIYARLVERTRQAEARNRFLANHDALTGLPNRNQFEEALQYAINGRELESCAVLCVDLDKFKPVNDTFGHHAGDMVIQTVAKRIAAAIGDHGIVARLGGDEFIALLHHATNKNEIMMICDALIESVCQEITFETSKIYVGASVGVAWWPEDALTADMVMRSADQALYRAKALGRGRAERADETGAQSMQRSAANS